MKCGENVVTTYNGVKVTGIVIHREGLTALVKVTTSSDHTVVRPGQFIPMSVPVTR